MRNLNFKYAGAWNFLPFGPDGIELHFEKFGKIILVRGENRDVKPIDSDLPSEECRISSNGSGKSTLQEILCYTLYGKTVKSPKKIGKNDVIHNLIGKKCRTEVIWDKYRVVRGRKPDFLRLWESETNTWDDTTEITVGDQRETQKKIEEILGLSYEAFSNICVFSDDQSACFLECDGPTKREIVENLLSLGVYRQYFDKSKSMLKEAKDNIKTLQKEYELLLASKSDAERRLAQTQTKEVEWKKARQAEFQQLVVAVKKKTEELKTMDTGPALLEWQQAQEKIQELNQIIPDLEAEQEKRRSKIALGREKEAELRDQARVLTGRVDDVNRQVKKHLEVVKEKQQFIADLQSNEPGTRCPSCYGLVDEANFEHAIKDADKEIAAAKQLVNKHLEDLKLLSAEIETLKEKQKKFKELIEHGEKVIATEDAKLRQLRSELVAASQVREPKADSSELLLQQQIEELKKQAKAKKDEFEGPSPFVDILANDQAELNRVVAECDSKKAEIQTAESELPYYEYWQIAFGDNGIRKWVVDGIIPALNSRIAYWLQFLIDNKISLRFDNQLEETIERNPPDGDPYIYHAMSAGQRRRLNLAVSQAFAHVMMVSTGAVPSLVFLDEVTTNIDPLGVQGIYNMICELAEDKQVFVTTHDPDLVRMLHGADVISLIHEDGITKLDAQ